MIGEDGKVKTVTDIHSNIGQMYCIRERFLNEDIVPPPDNSSVYYPLNRIYDEPGFIANANHILVLKPVNKDKIEIEVEIDEAAGIVSVRHWEVEYSSQLGFNALKSVSTTFRFSNENLNNAKQQSVSAAINYAKNINKSISWEVTVENFVEFQQKNPKLAAECGLYRVGIDSFPSPSTLNLQRIIHSSYNSAGNRNIDNNRNNRIDTGELMWLIGFWLGDGTIHRDQPQFTMAVEEREYTVAKLEIIANKMNLHVMELHENSLEYQREFQVLLSR